MNHAADIELLAAENSRRMSLLTTELDEIRQRTAANDRDCAAQRASAQQKQHGPEARTRRPAPTWTEAVTRSRTARRSVEVVNPTDDDDDPYYRRKSWLV
ncbi:hypothetical protein IU500_20575 [Nocardia terpenica]|uniref:Uncharacterized protein n=1 Tax=Nocardia terpenica TaxID=455432 RepID=A0A164IAA8_9NOCA|nr:hypothetical protein [Nocardia terpenica]KZM69245.1 hypothetical protein AWN90_16175 [Nocardia terpenica]MBF6061767.1 hypothetical protein [Nocardia terpenica]MBF6106432.1 hypothetical protein [Nocardia terpenica]MBF6110187.1 hypothetical protein [Nocardia terpenica]MBF6120976.1 hypothetical protein [Nocardia terpenica]